MVLKILQRSSIITLWQEKCFIISESSLNIAEKGKDKAAQTS